jgi:LppX_LprAFG lipoprotein
MSGEGDFRNNPNLGSMTLSVSGAQALTMQEVVKDTTIYMSSDVFRSELPFGKAWLSMDIAKTTKALGLDPSALSSSTQSPTEALATLRASGGRVTKVGAETIDGVSTTHYTAVLDADRVAKVSSALNKAYGASVTYQPVDVWIDGQDLVRRIHMAFSMGGGSTLPATSMDMTMAFSNYGEAVDVGVPRDDATLDVTKLAQSLKP